jgi:hypothetical protein
MICILKVKPHKFLELHKTEAHTMLAFHLINNAYKSNKRSDGKIEKVFIDYVGKFPCSKAGNTMLLVCVDRFSKIFWLLPAREATASTTVKVLRERVFQLIGSGDQGMGQYSMFYW